MGRLVTNCYRLLSTKVSKGPVRVQIAGDGHLLDDDDKYNDRIMSALVRETNRNKPDYVVVDGDYGNEYSFLGSSKNSAKTASMIRRTGAIWLFGMGNHDGLEKSTSKETPWLDRTQEGFDNFRHFISRENLDNVYFLDENGVAFDDKNIAFYSLDDVSSFYNLFEKAHEDKPTAIENFNNSIRNLGDDIDPRRFNVFKRHSPIWLVKNGSYLPSNEIPSYGNSKIDLIACGHTHSGGFGFGGKYNGGIYSPHDKGILHPSFPTDTRGIYCSRPDTSNAIGEVMEYLSELAKVESKSDLIKTLKLFAVDKIDLELINYIVSSPNILEAMYIFINSRYFTEQLPTLIISEGMCAMARSSLLGKLANSVFTHHVELVNIDYVPEERKEEIIAAYKVNPDVLTDAEKRLALSYNSNLGNDLSR